MHGTFNCLHSYVACALIISFPPLYIGSMCLSAPRVSYWERILKLHPFNTWPNSSKSTSRILKIRVHLRYGIMYLLNNYDSFCELRTVWGVIRQNTASSFVGVEFLLHAYASNGTFHSSLGMFSSSHIADISIIATQLLVYRTRPVLRNSLVIL